MNIGALQLLPLRQLMTPLPYSPPMMNAAFFTDGIAATHSARFQSSSEMPLSGALRISSSTLVAFRSRDVWSACAELTQSRLSTLTSKAVVILRIVFPPQPGAVQKRVRTLAKLDGGVNVPNNSI